MHYSQRDNRKYITVVTQERPEETEAFNNASLSRDGDVRECTDVISVLLVDDHTLFREGLRQLLSWEQDIVIVGEAANGQEALESIEQLRPDVVLMDIHLPGIDGLVLTRQITQQFPFVSIIMLTMYQQSQYMVQAMKNGAQGYLSKSASAREVAETIRHVCTQGIAVQPEITHALINEFRRLSQITGNGDVPTSTLSEREIEIIRYVATGMSNKEIAAKLAYSEKTVKNYLTVIYQKLHLRDRTQVAIFALRKGILPAEDAAQAHLPS
jgi:DNA-binding NarL/FixJ family response regulator